MGVRGRRFDRSDLTPLSDKQLIERFERERKAGTYTDNPRVMTAVLNTCKGIVTFYYSRGGYVVLSDKQRRTLIDFQYHSDNDSTSTYYDEFPSRLRVVESTQLTLF